MGSALFRYFYLLHLQLDLERLLLFVDLAGIEKKSRSPNQTPLQLLSSILYGWMKRVPSAPRKGSEEVG